MARGTRSREEVDGAGTSHATRTKPRLFIAVPLSDAVRVAVTRFVEGIQEELARTATTPRSEVRWVRTDGLHLTIRFLGPTPAERIDELALALEAVAAQTPPFDIRVAGAGAFPSAGRPRTLWLGIAAGNSELETLAKGLEWELERLGWLPDERPFRAHLTLARADGRREGPAAARLLTERARILDETFRANRLVLFESVTGGGPARYEPLHVAALRGTA